MSKFNVKKFIRSFGHAFQGVYHLLETEQNARVHFVVAIMAGISAVSLKLSRLEAALLFFAIVLVFAIEIINTAVEKLLDLVHPESHHQIRFIKDALAGAVLISATIAVVVGILIFYPHIRNLLPWIPIVRR